MILSFDDFLNESVNISPDEFIKEFMQLVNDIPRLNNAIQDVWCMPKEMFDAYRDDFKDTALKLKAEQFESTQRKLPEDKRLKTLYFMLEYKIDLSSEDKFHNMHIYRILGIDMQNKELIFFNTWGGLEHKIEEIFNSLLKKYFPTLVNSRKYGL